MKWANLCVALVFLAYVHAWVCGIAVRFDEPAIAWVGGLATVASGIAAAVCGAHASVETSTRAEVARLTTRCHQLLSEVEEVRSELRRAMLPKGEGA